MAGVFGTPITLDTVRATGLYPEPITQRACADYALKMSNAGGRDTAALRYVDNLKAEYGTGVSAKCILYNATGTTLDFVTAKESEGHIRGSPFPDNIMNGQWGGFFHAHPEFFVLGSVASVVYRSLLPDHTDQYCDWSYSWSIPYSGPNRVYTLIREPGHFSDRGYRYWNEYLRLLDSSQHNTEDKNYGYTSEIMIAEGTTSLVRGVFKMSPP